MAWSTAQKCLAEFLGTFALLLFGGGAAVTTLGGLEPLSRDVVVSLAFGIAVLGGAYALGEVSGGHFNPAVTISMAVGRRMPLKDVVPYLVSQIVGGVVGILVVAGIVYGDSTAWNNAVSAGFGSQCYAASNSPCGFSLGSVFLIEFALTFLFAFIILRVTRAGAGAANLAPIAIGLTLAVTNLVAIPVDGASINPVRSFSPALVTAMVGGGAPSWPIDEAWLFWLAPILGGIVAAIVEMAFRPGPDAAPAPSA